eukprot:m.597688 g.597688  ORF g.597688 m.597688 type:complete len:357 (-) comp22417_c0_seq4:673-1743(-)
MQYKINIPLHCSVLKTARQKPLCALSQTRALQLRSCTLHLAVCRSGSLSAPSRCHPLLPRRMSSARSRCPLARNAALSLAWPLPLSRSRSRLECPSSTSRCRPLVPRGPSPPGRRESDRRWRPEMARSWLCCRALPWPVLPVRSMAPSRLPVPPSPRASRARSWRRYPSRAAEGGSRRIRSPLRLRLRRRSRLRARNGLALALRRLRPRLGLRLRVRLPLLLLRLRLPRPRARLLRSTLLLLLLLLRLWLVLRLSMPLLVVELEVELGLLLRSLLLFGRCLPTAAELCPLEVATGAESQRFPLALLLCASILGDLFPFGCVDLPTSCTRCKGTVVGREHSSEKSANTAERFRRCPA